MRIRKLQTSDYDNWQEIYHTYAEHYNVQLTENIKKTTWDWLMDRSHPVRGLVCIKDYKLVGLAHYRGMPSPLDGQNLGFLDDLVVHKDFRGMDIANKLLKEIKSIGKKEGWKSVSWITKDNNYRARSIYDKLAEKTDWALYEMNCK